LEAVPGDTGRRKFFILMRRAALLQAIGKVREADVCLSEAMGLARGMKGRGRRLEALAFREKEKLLRASGGYEEALRRAILRHETILGPNHPYVGRGLYHLGILMEEQGRDPEAEQYYLRSLEIHRKQLGPTHPVIATFLNHLASLHRKNGAYEEAKIYLMQMVGIYEENFRRTDPKKLDALKSMVLRTQVDVTPVIRDLIRFEEKQSGPDHPDLAQSLRYYAMLLESKQQYEEAESMLRRALRIYEKNYPPEHPHLIFARKRLAQCLFSQGKAEEAVVWTEETLAAERKAQGERPSALMPTVYTLALYLQGAGRFPEAERAYRRVLEFYENRIDGKDPFLREISGKLVEVLLAQGKDAAAGNLQKRLQGKKFSREGKQAPSSACPRGNDENAVDF
jgi:tetratricopeptide (TPR) repeat protein